MPVDMIALAPLQRRRDVGSAVEDVAHVADRRGVKNAVHRLGIILGAFVHPLDAGPFAGGIHDRHSIVSPRCLRYGLPERTKFASNE